MPRDEGAETVRKTAHATVTSHTAWSGAALSFLSQNQEAAVAWLVKLRSMKEEYGVHFLFHKAHSQQYSTFFLRPFCSATSRASP